jgi:hypothetical protein
MKLGFFTVPIYPLGRDLAETLREDQERALIADHLGFTEGHFGEPSCLSSRLPSQLLD